MDAVQFVCERIDDYWDEEDEPVPEDEEHQAELGKQRRPKLPFAFFVDENIPQMVSTGLPADECIGALRVRWDKSVGKPIHEKCERLSRATYAPWPLVRNEYGVLPWISSYRRYLAEKYGDMLNIDRIGRTRPTNREMLGARYKMSDLEKFFTVTSEDRARYKREMEAARASDGGRPKRARKVA
jgi:hypothetical protein